MVSLSLCIIYSLLLIPSIYSEDNQFTRQSRAFPYSVSFVKLLTPEGSLSAYPSNIKDDLSQLIDAINKPGAYLRERRNMAEPVKRYACRFKFCRIFDA